MEAALDALLQERTARLLLRSLGLAAAVTVSAILIALPAAWITARSDIAGRRLWAVALALPLVIPSYIGAYAYIAALGPRGMLQGSLGSSLGIERLPDITGFFGAWLVLTLFTYPLVMLPVRAMLLRSDPSLEEAARSMGRGPRNIFMTITVPQAAPAIGAGALLVSLYVLSDFGAVSIMQFNSFTLDIHTAYGASFDRTGAASLALLLVGVMVAILWAESRFQRRRSHYRSGPGVARRAEALGLGRWRAPALLFCGSVVTAALLLPLVVLIRWTFSAVGGGTESPAVFEAAVNSLTIAGAAAIACTVSAVPISYLLVRHRGSLAVAIERLSFTGYALPGIVVALSLVFFGTRLVPALYQTEVMLVFAFVVLFVPMAITVIRSSLAQVSPRLNEAARSLGRSPISSFGTVTLPLIRMGIVSALALVCLTALKELPATLILSPIGFSTLATEVWQSSRVAFFERGAVPALILIGASVGPLYLLLARDRWSR